MPKNVSVPHATIDGIVTARGLESCHVSFERFEINEGETLTIPAGHSVEVRALESWVRIYCPNEVTVAGPMLYATPKPCDFQPSPSVFFDDDAKRFSTIASALISFIAGSVFVSMKIDIHTSSPLLALLTFASIVCAGALAAYASTCLANVFYRMRNPTPAAEQLAKPISVAFPEAEAA